MLEYMFVGLGAFVVATWLRMEQRLTRIETKISILEQVIKVGVRQNDRGAKTN